MSAIQTTSAAALQDYTRQFATELFERAYFSFDALEHARMLDGVKGEVVLTQLEIGNLLKRASTTFAPIPNIINYRPRRITTVAVDVDFEINPKVLANTYLEGLRAKGQNGRDIPYEGQVMGGLVNKMKEEHQVAFFQGSKATTPAASDLMRACFDGMIALGKKFRTDGLVPTAVGGGAYTTSNIVASFQAQAETLGAEVLEEGTEMFCSRRLLLMYIDAYNAANPNRSLMYIRNKAGNVIGTEMANGLGKIYAKNGYGSSNFVLATKRGNFVWATDDASDADGFQFKDQIKTIQFTTQIRVGMDCIFADASYVAVNDLN